MQSNSNFFQNVKNDGAFTINNSALYFDRLNTKLTIRRKNRRHLTNIFNIFPTKNSQFNKSRIFIDTLTFIMKQDVSLTDIFTWVLHQTSLVVRLSVTLCISFLINASFEQYGGYSKLGRASTIMYSNNIEIRQIHLAISSRAK